MVPRKPQTPLWCRVAFDRMERRKGKTVAVFKVRWWHPFVIWAAIKSALKRDFTFADMKERTQPWRAKRKKPGEPKPLSADSGTKTSARATFTRLDWCMFWFVLALAAFALVCMAGCAATAGSDLRDALSGNRRNGAQVRTEEHYGDGTRKPARTHPMCVDQK